MTTREQLEAKLRAAGLDVHPLYVEDSVQCFEQDPTRYPQGLDSLVALERERQWSEKHYLNATVEERQAHDRRSSEALGLPYVPPLQLTPEQKRRVIERVREAVSRMKARGVR